jgi:hypothetical protein
VFVNNEVTLAEKHRFSGYRRLKALMRRNVPASISGCGLRRNFAYLISLKKEQVRCIETERRKNKKNEYFRKFAFFNEKRGVGGEES